MKILIILSLCLTLTMTNQDALQEFISGNNLFTAAIYQEALKETQGNFLISPFSIETVLALTQSGAKDETAQEIRTGLRLPSTTEKTESAYATLLPNLKGNEFYALHSANKIYVKNGLPLKNTFRNIATKIYHAGIENVDFAQNVQTAENINGWVEKQTNNKIHNLIEPESIGQDTSLVLINALYFKGKWSYPFEKFATKKKDFYKSANVAVQVDTMHNTDLYNYYESAELNAKFLELPYEGDDVSMVIVLPNETDGLRVLESNIEKVFSAPRFTQERVSVALPKFTIEHKVNLNNILQNLGIRTAFTDGADLSGIAGKKGDLAISKVLQKSFINVTESGTEAAAATSVQIVRTSAIIHQTELSFIADRPFIFYIKTKNVILFNGRIILPK